MILATCGWGAFWCSAIWARLAEGWAPSPELAYWISTPLALAGFGMAVFTIRGQRSWLLFVSVPLIAIGFLMILPLVLPNAGGLHGEYNEKNGATPREHPFAATPGEQTHAGKQGQQIEVPRLPAETERQNGD